MPTLRLLFAGFYLLTAFVAPAYGEKPLRLGLPLECDYGKTCFIQNYVDHRRDKGYQDYHCGFLTNDRHSGTDFRLPDHAALANGVAVIAAAAGTVHAVRDGMPDVDFRLVGANAVLDRGLGNVVVIDHGGSWRTYYGHMRRSSVAVAKGQRVAAGQKLGVVGLSGFTEFPHIHFELRFGKKVVDPFVGLETHTGCGAGKNAMWRPEILSLLVYRPTFLIRAGFSDRLMTKTALQYGLYDRTVLRRKLKNLHFSTFVAGLYAGDRYMLNLTDDNGKTLKTLEGVFEKPAAVQFRSIGYNRNTPLPAGTYHARYELHGVRNGKQDLVLKVERSVTLR